MTVSQSKVLTSLHSFPPPHPYITQIPSHSWALLKFTGFTVNWFTRLWLVSSNHKTTPKCGLCAYLLRIIDQISPSHLKSSLTTLFKTANLSPALYSIFYFYFLVSKMPAHESRKLHLLCSLMYPQCYSRTMPSTYYKINEYLMKT